MGILKNVLSKEDNLDYSGVNNEVDGTDMAVAAAEVTQVVNDVETATDELDDAMDAVDNADEAVGEAEAIASSPNATEVDEAVALTQANEALNIAYKKLGLQRYNISYESYRGNSAGFKKGLQLAIEDKTSLLDKLKNTISNLIKWVCDKIKKFVQGILKVITFSKNTVNDLFKKAKDVKSKSNGFTYDPNDHTEFIIVNDGVISAEELDIALSICGLENLNIVSLYKGYKDKILEKVKENINELEDVNKIKFKDLLNKFNNTISYVNGIIGKLNSENIVSYYGFDDKNTGSTMKESNGTFVKLVKVGNSIEETDVKSDGTFNAKVTFEVSEHHLGSIYKEDDDVLQQQNKDLHKTYIFTVSELGLFHNSNNSYNEVMSDVENILKEISKTIDTLKITNNSLTRLEHELSNNINKHAKIINDPDKPRDVKIVNSALSFFNRDILTLMKMAHISSTVGVKSLRKISKFLIKAEKEMKENEKNSN